jgi:ArsR family transcriptional regulator
MAVSRLGLDYGKEKVTSRIMREPRWLIEHSLFSVARICTFKYIEGMDIISVYKCMCDRQRLRILNLLKEGPLCVCHLMEILEADQVKISKQLRFMKKLGMVVSERRAQWMIYRLARTPNPLLEENLKCLQDCKGEGTRFRNDLQKRKRLLATLQPCSPLQSLTCPC